MIGKALNTQRLNHVPLQLSRIEVRASGPWRALEVLGGVIVIALAIFALADPQFTIQTLVIVIAAGLIIGGLFRITVGAFATILPSPLRGFNVTGGVIAFVLGIAALLDLQAVVATLIGILAVALLLCGSARNWSRGRKTPAGLAESSDCSDWSLDDHPIGLRYP